MASEPLVAVRQYKVYVVDRIAGFLSSEKSATTLYFGGGWSESSAISFDTASPPEYVGVLFGRQSTIVKENTMRVPLALYGALLCLCAAPILSAQDAVKADPKHYTVMSENDKVRILKVHYGPHEKSVMHSHPDGVMVALTDCKVQFTDADGKKTDMACKAGDAQSTTAGTHLPENVSDAGMDLILVELKTK
jgi:hypothetical protein